MAFISFARADLAMVERLRDSLALVGCNVWMDLQTGGGRDWWAAILEQVRGCDLFIAVLSPAGLQSLACTRQREYATALGKPVLPVRVAPVSARILPPALARVNIIDYTQPDAFQTGVHLSMAVARMPAPPPLPDPLPPEPPIPLSYLAELGERVHAPHLTLEEQMAVTAMLRDALTRPVDHDDAVTLAEAFADRDDLYYRANQQVQELLRGAARPSLTAHESGLASTRHEMLEAENFARPPHQATQLRRSGIFLCYRRDDTQGFARGIYERLAAKYGHERVFRDIDSTPVGVRYATWIESTVGRSSVMIVLIGDGWLSAKDRAGQRRLDSPEDWVRLEIEAALRQGIPIIPVRVQGASMPSEEKLPRSIADLAGFQSAEVSDSRWNFDVGQLIQAIDNLIASD